jgi:hypothetical protein
LLVLIVAGHSVHADNHLEQAQQAIGQAQSAILLATKSLVRQPGAAAKLGPVLAMVVGMMDQITNDTSHDVSQELSLRSGEQNELTKQALDLQNTKLILEMKLATIQVLTQEKDHADNASVVSNQMLPEVLSALQHHSDNCMMRVPDLIKRKLHTENDLKLLSTLTSKLDQLSANQSTAAELTVMLPQIHHSLRLFESATSSKLLKPLTGGSKIRDSGALIETGVSTHGDADRMRQLLDKLTAELNQVLDSETHEINQINETCLTQERDLILTRDRLTKTIEKSHNVSTQREKELVSARLDETAIRARILKIETSITQLQTETKKKMQVYLALMKSRQHVLLMLSGMRNILTTLNDSLMNLELPVISAHANRNN